MAQKPHEPSEENRKLARALSAYGIPQEDIARRMGLSRPTLTKYYDDDLASGMMEANAKVGEFLYGAASGAALKQGASYSDCIRAAMFWGKTRMGWRETNVHEHSGPNGGPIRTKHELTDDELAIIAAGSSIGTAKAEES